MTHKFSKNYIRSTATEIDRKKNRGAEMVKEGEELIKHADALQKMLVDGGVSVDEIMLVLQAKEQKAA